MPPLVSIVIPAYNAERFLKDTVRSALAQSHIPCEIIVVDDGSTDGTAEAIRSLAPSVRKEFLPHGGVSAARNHGTRLSRGEFIQYLDADDLLRPDAVKARVAALSESNADVAYSDWQKIEEQSDGRFATGETVCRRIEDIDPDPEVAVLTRFWAPPAALLYRKSLVDMIGPWSESVSPIEDARFMQEAMLRGGRFIYVPGVGADYRVLREGSHSRRDPEKFVRSVFINVSQIEDRWAQQDSISFSRRRALKEVYDYVARASFNTDEGLFGVAVQKLYQHEPFFRPTWPKLAAFFRLLLGRDRTLALMKNLGKMKACLRGAGKCGNVSACLVSNKGHSPEREIH